MHASIFISFEEFTATCCGEAARAALEGVVPRTAVLPFKTYPDELAVAAVQAVARAERCSAAELLRRYGRFFPGWARPRYTAAFAAPTVREFLLGVARAHAVAKTVSRGAEPPEIEVREAAGGRLTVAYASPRRLCPIVHGMVEGLGDVYGEGVEVEETSCVAQGAAACHFEVRPGGRTVRPAPLRSA
jgi:hypothetical protein